MKTISRWRSVGDPILALAWAPRCAVCDGVLAQPTQGVVCPDCWQRVGLSTPPVCESCGAPRSGLGYAQGEERGLRCRMCQELPGHIRRRSAGPYDGVLRLLVHALKYGGRRSLAVPLGNLLRRAGRELLSDADYVVPVPLYPLRRWTRGFNQATDLARQVGLPVVEALYRRRATLPQTGLTAAERKRNVRSAFAVKRRWRHRDIDGRRIVIIDDVYTTGATMEACADPLRQAGARQVSGLTIALRMTMTTTTPVPLPKTAVSAQRPRQQSAQPDARRSTAATSGLPLAASSSPSHPPGGRSPAHTDRVR